MTIIFVPSPSLKFHLLKDRIVKTDTLIYICYLLTGRTMVVSLCKFHTLLAFRLVLRLLDAIYGDSWANHVKLQK